jgi:hypothetical protein
MRYLCSALASIARKMQAFRERVQIKEDMAEARGLALLREWLSEEQRRQFDASKAFEVIGCDSRKRYRIRHGTGTTVHEIDDDGRPIMGFCFVPTGSLVPGDVMLAQKIALETNERAALAIANKFPVRPHDRETPVRLIRRAY